MEAPRQNLRTFDVSKNLSVTEEKNDKNRFKYIETDPVQWDFHKQFPFHQIDLLLILVLRMSGIWNVRQF